MSSSEKDWIKKLIPQEQSSDLDEKDLKITNTSGGQLNP